MDELTALRLLGVELPECNPSKPSKLGQIPKLSETLRSDLRRRGVKDQQATRIAALAVFSALAKPPTKARLQDVRDKVQAVSQHAALLAKSIGSLAHDIAESKEARDLLLGDVRELGVHALDLAQTKVGAEAIVARAETVLLSMRNEQTRSLTSMHTLVGFIDRALKDGWEEWVRVDPGAPSREKVRYPYAPNYKPTSEFRQIVEMVVSDMLGGAEVVNAERGIRKYLQSLKRARAGGNVMQEPVPVAMSPIRFYQGGQHVFEFPTSRPLSSEGDQGH